MRFSLALSRGIRRFGFSPGVSGGGDLEPDVLSITPSGQTAEFALDEGKKHRHLMVMVDITFSGVDSMVLEFRRKSDGLYEQGASAYQIKELITSTGTNPVLAANMPAGDYDAGRGDLFGYFMITAGVLAVPTECVSRDWDNGAEMHDCIMNNEDIHDNVRLRITGSEAFTGGTIYLVRME